MTDHAKRVATTLNRFVGMLHAAQCTGALWILYAGDSRYTFAAQYGLQMTFGTAMLTLRKLQDLSTTGQLREHSRGRGQIHPSPDAILRQLENQVPATKWYSRIDLPDWLSSPSRTRPIPVDALTWACRHDPCSEDVKNDIGAARTKNTHYEMLPFAGRDGVRSQGREGAKGRRLITRAQAQIC